MIRASTVAASAMLFLAGETSAAESDWIVRAELLVVKVPIPDALRLMPNLPAKRASSGVEEILALVTEGKAELVGSPVLWTRSGVEGDAGTWEEFRYSTEFTPRFGADGKYSISYAWRLVFQAINVPTAFETRNVGVTLTIEPTVGSEGRTITSHVVSELVSFAQMRRTFQPPRGANPVFEQPEFRVRKLDTIITSESSRWGLIQRAADGDKLELFLLRLTALPTPQ